MVLVSASPRFSLPLVITALSWGMNFVAIKALYAQTTPAALSVIRFVPMYLLLLAICAIRRESLRYPKEDAVRILYLGFMAMGVYMVLFLEGMRGTGAAEGAILIATAPVMSILLESATGQARFRWGVLGGATVAFGGVLVVLLGEPVQMRGDLVANGIVFASAVVWAYCGTLMRPLIAKYGPLRTLTLSMPGGLAVLIPYGATAAVATSFGDFTPRTWLMLGHVTVFAGVVAFLGFFEGVRQIGAGAAMLYQYMVPPLAAIFAWWVLGAPLHASQLLGLAVVIGGVAWATRARREAPVAAAAEL